MKKIIFILVMFTGLTGFKLNNTRRITGTVSDSGGILPGASVIVDGTHIGTVTDGAGHYIIDVPGDKNTWYLNT